MPVRREAEGSPAEGSPRYWAWLYSPPRLRAVLEALLAIEDEIRAVLRPGLDHHVAHVRLEWWREECDRYASGSPAHPLTRRLLAAHGAPATAPAATPPPPLAPAQAPAPAAAHAAARPDPGGLIDTITWDLASATFATRAELTGYCERWASAVTLIAAQAAADSPLDREVTRFGRSLGRALKEIELLADLASDARLGRLRLPLDELERAGIEPPALARPPWPAPLCALLRARQRAARAALAASVAELPASLQPPVRGLLVWAAVAHRGSLRAEQTLPHPRQAGRASRLADAWLGWRAARLADRRRFRLVPEASP